MVKVKVDSAKLEKQLKEFTKALNKTAEESIIDLAKAGATQLAYRLEPYGLTKKAQGTLEGAVYKDISRTYWDTGRTYNEIKKISKGMAAAYAEAINSGDDNKAQKIASKVISGFSVGKTDDGKHLESSRNGRGRVSTAKPMGITDKAELSRLKALKALTAGTAKAGFLQAGASLGSKGRIAKWLKKPGELGTSNILKNGWQTVVTLINKVRYASDVITESKIQAAIANAYKNTLKRMGKQLEALAKKI